MGETGRYDNVPISDKTRAGMTLTIDDLAAIGRLLTLQDDAYDEQFEKLFFEIRELREEVKLLKDSVAKLTVKVDCIDSEVDELREEVERLKKLNSFGAIVLRIAIGVGIALGLGWALHQKL